MATPKPRGQIFNKDLERGEADTRGNEGSLMGRGSRFWNGPPSTPWVQMPSLNDLDANHYFYGREDFLLSPSALAWVPITDGSSGTDIHQDAVGGVMSLVTAASDNDYKAYRTPRKFFKFATGKEAAVEMRFKLTEATTDDSTWWLALTDTTTTGGMQADALGPPASYDGATIWKTPETAHTVNFEVSNAGSQSTLSAFATGGSGSWSRAAFYFDGVDKFTPYFSIDDGVTWTTGTAQTIAPSLTGMDEMHLLFGVKAGPGAAAETLEVDWVQFMQLR